jgi:murein DD-endopeptidase
MQFITRLSRWALSGPRAWLSIIGLVFVVLLFVYRALVSPTENPDEYVIPSVKNSKSATVPSKVAPNRNTD